MVGYDTIVIGGGAAGLMAAGQSAEKGEKVLVLERMERPGRKLSITGKGRCNITNTAPQSEFVKNVNPNGRFLKSCFSSFFSKELVDFFNQIGIKTVTERGGRVFPENGKAVEVVKAMIKWCNSNHVTIKTNIRVKNLITNQDRIIGVRTIQEKSSNKEIISYAAKKVIVATGGVSYPATGSTGDGYELAKSVGHSINEISPALVPLETEGSTAKHLNGLELKNVKAVIWADGRKVAEDFGEMSFTEYGITGPIVLSLSRMIVLALKEKKEVVFSIDLKAALDDKKLDNRLLRDFDQKGKESFRDILKGLLPKDLITTCIRSTNIDASTLGHQINSEQRKHLRKWLKNFNLKITGHRNYDEAIITAGGINTDEINQKTMESKLIKGLYFVGEVLDLDAPTGGYNLQIAFSTAVAAARA